MKIAIVVDSWKAPIFRTELDGYKYEELVMDSIITFKVETTEVEALSDVVMKANKRALESRN